MEKKKGKREESSWYQEQLRKSIVARTPVSLAERRVIAQCREATK